jgi:hypothetical protein
MAGKHEEAHSYKELPASDDAKQLMADYKFIKDQMGQCEDPMPVLELLVLGMRKPSSPKC